MPPEMELRAMAIRLVRDGREGNIEVGEDVGGCRGW